MFDLYWENKMYKRKRSILLGQHAYRTKEIYIVFRCARVNCFLFHSRNFKNRQSDIFGCQLHTGNTLNNEVFRLGNTLTE